MSQAYSVTIQLPTEFAEEKTTEITKKFIEVLKKRKLTYIQAYETENHKYHSHIGYLASPQKSTSNETKLFAECFDFKKKDYPNAISHKKHKDWKYLIGYVSKEAETIQSTLDKAFIKECKRYFNNKKDGKKKDKKDYYTVNQIYELFKQEIAKNSKLRLYIVPETEEEGYCGVREFFLGIKDNISGSTWQKLNFRKLIQFGRLHGLQEPVEGKRELNNVIKNFI